MLQIDTALLALVDVQGKLATLMHRRERLFDSLRRMVAGSRALGLPILWVEQNPLHMGRTAPEIAAELEGLEPVRKMSFSCMGNEDFTARLDALARPQVLLCGIETHVCIYQTAIDLLASGREVEVIADAVSSRTAANRLIGLERIREAGGRISSVEMALFELLRTAEHPSFKDVLRVVK